MKYFQVVDDSGNIMEDETPEPPKILFWGVPNFTFPIESIGYLDSEGHVRILTTNKTIEGEQFETEKELLTDFLYRLGECDFSITYVGLSFVMKRVDSLSINVEIPMFDSFEIKEFSKLIYGYLEPTIQDLSLYLLDRTVYSGTNIVRELDNLISIIRDVWDLISPSVEYIVNETGVRYSEVGTGVDTNQIILATCPHYCFPIRHNESNIK